MKEIITMNGITREVIHIKGWASPKNLCRPSAGVFDHLYEQQRDHTGNKFQSCVRCGNMPI